MTTDTCDYDTCDHRQLRITMLLAGVDAGFSPKSAYEKQNNLGFRWGDLWQGVLLKRMLKRAKDIITVKLMKAVVCHHCVSLVRHLTCPTPHLSDTSLVRHLTCPTPHLSDTSLVRHLTCPTPHLSDISLFILFYYLSYIRRSKIDYRISSNYPPPLPISPPMVHGK